MNRTSLWVALAVSAAVAPASSFAQAKVAPAKVLKDKEAVTYKEVERGFYLGATAGPWYLLNAPASHGPTPFSPGLMTQVEIGTDIGERLSVAVFVEGATNSAGSDYLGKSNPPGTASGDFSSITPGAVVRVAAVGFPDAQDVERTWVYVRAGAGVVIFSPKTLLPDPDIMVFAGPGVEYHTRLRHFSVGLEVTGAFLLTSGSVGFAISPNLRYAF